MTSTSDPDAAVRGSEERKGRKNAGHRDKEVLAVTSGFVLPPPLALMHCDMLQVFTKGWVCSYRSCGLGCVPLWLPPLALMHCDMLQVFTKG